MSAVRNVTDAVEMVVPSLGSETEPDAYKCRNCGRESENDVGSCPNCSSPNLRPLYR